MTRCGHVGALAIGQQVERLTQRALDIGERCLGGLDVVFGLLTLPRQPVSLEDGGRAERDPAILASLLKAGQQAEGVARAKDLLRLRRRERRARAW